MLSTVTVAATLIAGLTAAPLPAQHCDVMHGADVRALAAALDAAAAAGPVWGDYTIANHPVVFVSQTPDTTAGACAAVWRYGQALEVVPLSRGMRLSTPLYAMWNVDPVGPNPAAGNGAIVSTLRSAPPELEDALRARGSTRAVIVPAPLRFEDLGALGRSLQSMNIRPTPLLAQLAIHESYHLHSQFPAWLDQQRRYEWPPWDVQPDRKRLVAQCYGATPAVTETLRREMAALEHAWLLLMGDRDSVTDAMARDSARVFVRLRRDRHALLDGVTIPSAVGPMTCRRAEDVMELEEGAPQWIAYATAQQAGLIGVEGVGRRAAEAFYASGTFQLWILQRLLGPEAMRNLTHEITRSTEPEGDHGAIFARFSKLLSPG
jgi:hypothetical protein